MLWEQAICIAGGRAFQVEEITNREALKHDPGWNLRVRGRWSLWLE